jgi:hypothetical protein
MLLSFTFIYLLDLGAVGLAYKMIIGQFIGTTIQLYYNSKFLDFKMKYFLSHQFYSIVFFFFLAYVASDIFPFESPIVSFLGSGFLYTILVIIFVYIFPQVFATTRDEIKQKIFRIK